MYYINKILLKMSTRIENFSEWYQETIKNADLADNSDVRGCMVIKPYGFAIWENIQKIFDTRIKQLGVQNAYFPLLIPLDFIAKEASHIDGFAKECAVVTHHRLISDGKGGLIPDGKLENPFVIRPTSEAIIGKTVSNWIQSYRDLPMKLNQWCNVMRWEMRPRMFLRTSEFLWQEGHTIFETENEAQEDAQKMHQEYYDFITNSLCIYGLKGEKTDEERFPGAVNTYTIETMTQDGKALQMATSHYLGQSFSTAFDIKFLGRENAQQKSFTASWGMSTRLIGGLIMGHSDDNGLILPPAIAPFKVVILPMLRGEETAQKVKDFCNKIKDKLSAMNISNFIDLSEEDNSKKMWKWIKKGAPIRLEIGPREAENNNITVARRDIDKNKTTISFGDIDNIENILQDISNNLLAISKQRHIENTKIIQNIIELEKLFDNNFMGFAKIKKDLTDNIEFEKICEKFALSRRCMLIEDDIEFVIVAKSY